MRFVYPRCGVLEINILIIVLQVVYAESEVTIRFEIYIYFNKMKKEVGMLLQKRTDTRAVGIYKLYEENTH